MSAETSLKPDFISLGYILKSWIAGLYGSSIVNYLRRLDTLFHNGYTNLHSHHQCTEVPFFLHPCQHMSCLCDNRHSNRCDVICHCGFDFHFSDH